MQVALLIRRLLPVVGALAVMAAPVEATGHAKPALAVSVAMVLAWLFESLHPSIVGFIGAFLFCAAAGLEFEEAFAGFGTPAPWLLYGVLMLHTSAAAGGLVRWIGTVTPQAIAGRPLPAAIVLVLLGQALPAVLPSSLARAALLVLLAAGWGHRQPRFRSLLVLVAALSGVAVGEAAVAGALPGALVAAAVLAGAALLGRGEGDAADAVAATDGTAPDWRIAAVVAAATALWLTSPLHGIAPAWVGLAAGLLCAVPGLARAAGPHAKSTADPLALILAGTAISIPAVLHETGGAEMLAGLLPSFHDSGASALHTYAVSVLYRLFSPDLASVALAPPAAVTVTGSGALAWTLAGSTLVSLHQAPALALAYSVGGVRRAQVLVMGGCILVTGLLAVLVW